MQSASPLQHRSVVRSLFALALVASVFTFGCHRKPPVTPTPTPPPAAPPPAKPTVSLTADPSTINRGDSSTLSWTSSNANQVSVAPDVGAVAAEGNTKVSPSDSTTYTITASGPGGSETATARVTVNAPAPPPVSNEPDLNALFLQEVRDAYFDFNKSDIRPDAQSALQNDAEFLRKYPQIKITVEGHCDERGSTEYNLGLGDRRANAVKQYLVSLGISGDRVNTVSFGKEKPFCMEHGETCWQQNRRGHFVKAN
jgi:peptidoglycan-associated lipoprotein